MEQKPTILEGYSDMEKGAYLGAIASLATADRSASEQELEYIEALCVSADLSESQEEVVKKAATEMTDEDLKRCLDTLKGSDLRFSLVSDLIAFAEADSDYSAEEKANVQKIANYLGVNQQQVAVLGEYTKKAVQAAPAQAESLEAGTTTPSNFLGGLGFGDKLKGAGINSNALLKGGLAVLGPIILAQMFRGGRRRSGGMFGGGGGLGSALGGGLLGGMLGGGGGMMGGGGGMLGGSGGGLLGGLLGGGGRRMGPGGGLFDMLSGGRGMGSTGGLLGNLFKRGGF
jgi:uncharacterized tellurite resistance protein B-like protein